MKKLYRFYWDCGRMGEIESLFIEDDKAVEKALEDLKKAEEGLISLMPVVKALEDRVAKLEKTSVRTDEVMSQKEIIDEGWDWCFNRDKIGCLPPRDMIIGAPKLFKDKNWECVDIQLMVEGGVI